MNNTLEYITSITLLIAIVVAITCTLIVIIDYHKQWKLIEKYYKKDDKNDKRRK